MVFNYLQSREKAEAAFAAFRENGGKGLLIRADATDARPSYRVGFQSEGLIAGSDIERAFPGLRFVAKLHGEKIHLGWKTREQSFFDP